MSYINGAWKVRRARRPGRFAARMAWLCLCVTFAAPIGSQERGPDLRIETFAPEHGYIVGVDSVVLLGVARNIGGMPLPENSMRLRCYPISGLDYTIGNLLPAVPALAPGQAVAYRWRFTPSDARSALIAGLALERTEAGNSVGALLAAPNTQHPTPNTQHPTPSSLAFAVVPRLPHTPTFGDTPAFKDPLAHASERDGAGLLLNTQVGARIQVGDRREAYLVLAAKEGTAWKTIAAGLPLLRACVGEDGQRPWWQNFRCQQIRAHEDKAGATLTLTGMIGSACRAEITLEARPNTCILAGKLRLNAPKPLRLSGLQMPCLLANADDKTLLPPRPDGSPALLPDTPSPLPDDARLAAGHSGATTFGLAWPAEPPLPGWKWARLPLADGVTTFAYGAQATGDARGDAIPVGTGVELPFRLFAFTPSDTVRDALRFQMP